MTETLDRIRASLVSLRMPRALEALEHTVRRLERGEISVLEAIDGLPAEEHATREGRRGGVALKTAPHAAEDAGELRLLLPALARPQPDHGARPARLRRPRRGRPLPRPARNRQVASRLGPRRRGGEGRPQRLSLHARRARRGARARRARGPADREDPLPRPAQPAHRRRDRLPPDHARRRRPLLPAGERPIREGRDDPRHQPRLRRVGRGLPRPRRRHRAARPAAPSRRRRPHRGRQLPPPPACRSRPRACPRPRRDNPSAAAEAPRETAEEQEPRSRRRLITGSRRLGNFASALPGRFRSAFTRNSSYRYGRDRRNPPASLVAPDGPRRPHRQEAAPRTGRERGAGHASNGSTYENNTRTCVPQKAP